MSEVKQAQKVWVVVKCADGGPICGVFSTQEKAGNYIDRYQYNAYVIREYTVNDPYIEPAMKWSEHA